MSERNLRKKPRISYQEPEEIPLDKYVYCDSCSDYVCEFCSIHGPLLVIPDDEVSSRRGYPSCVPRAAHTIPKAFLHLAPSIIPGAGIGVFSSLTLPRGVRFGPFTGKRYLNPQSEYCWQIYNADNRPSHVVDAADADNSNWMRYVNCSRHWQEQNLIAFQYEGQLYYRTIKIVPRFSELLVFYGKEFAQCLHINLTLYNLPAGYAQFLGTSYPVEDEEKEILDRNATLFAENKRAVEININLSEPVSEDIQYWRREDFDRNAVEIIHNESVEKTVPTSLLKIIPKSKPLLDFKNNDKYHQKDLMFRCNHCGIKCSSKNGLLQHYSKFHDENRKFCCDVCGFRFQEKFQLRRHIARVHLRSSLVQEGREEKDANIVDFNRAHIINESNINTAFDSFNNDRKDVSNDNKLFYTKEDLKKTFFQCKKCTYKSRSETHLLKHTSLHDPNRKFKCQCGSRFKTNTGFRRHVNSANCIKENSATEKEQLTVEDIFLHCDKCDFKTLTERHLALHKLLHDESRKFKCGICDFRFKGQFGLQRHTATHFKQSKLDSCADNPTSLTHRDQINLNTNKITHLCPKCDKQFVSPYNLRRHLKTHIQRKREKMYACRFCSSSFLSLDRVKEHYYSHMK